jgi:hypothetical protein
VPAANEEANVETRGERAPQLTKKGLGLKPLVLDDQIRRLTPEPDPCPGRAPF